MSSEIALYPVESCLGSNLTLWDNIDNLRAVEAGHAISTWVRDIIAVAGAAY